MPRDTLTKYRAKRDFKKTPEPAGLKGKESGQLYLIQKHAATRLHYDFRLELDGVLKSWAVTRGPSLNPNDKRLAVEVEDHPVAYGSFEGIIPKGQYGGGTVMLWDTGTWEPIGDPNASLKKGHLSFILHGGRLQGEWALVRMPDKEKGRHNWLLIKKKDKASKTGNGEVFLKKNASSITSGRSMEEIAAAKDASWQSKPATRKKEKPVVAGRKQAAPKFIAPQLATLSSAMPKGDTWVHEVKFDGYRIQAHVRNGNVRMFTRTGQDWTNKFGDMPELLSNISADTAILDGELIAPDAHGISSFKELQAALKEKGEGLQYYLFDLLYLNGHDLRSLTLLERKELLQTLLEKNPAPERIFYSEHFTHRGEEFLDHACRLRLEGIISKQANAAYTSGRSKVWLKSKCHQRQEFVIAGFTPPTKGSRGIGALLLAYYKGKELHYAGKVGTGFSFDLSLELRKKLSKLKQGKALAKERGAVWVEPRLVCEVEFTEWTPDGKLRHPSFQGLREDKPAKTIHRDVPVAVTDKGKVVIGGIALSHPDRVVYPSSGITKQQLASYYESVAEWILPYLKDRPISVIRCPDGTNGECFFQRHIGLVKSPYLHEVDIPLKHKHEKYLVIRDAKGLLTLIQWGAIELHPWGARANTIERPDYITFDLDPGPGVPWARVIKAALELRSRMKDMKLQSFIKTTGGKGLHIVVPIAARYPWEMVKPFARSVADAMEKDSPKEYTANLSKAARKGRIFIDYLRNGKSATAVAPYSARAREHATISMPLEWKDVTEKLDPLRYTVETATALLAKQKHDPWEDFFELKQSLPK